jgi:hypothetical protein
MTWWAISLTLLNHPLGNEIMSREQLLHIVPIFVAVLVWLTRILFIGSLTVAGEHIFAAENAQLSPQPAIANPAKPKPAPKPTNNRGGTSNGNGRLTNNPGARSAPAASFTAPTGQPVMPIREPQAARPTPTPASMPQRTSRIRRPDAHNNGQTRMSTPPGPATRPNMPIGMKASPPKRYS